LRLLGNNYTYLIETNGTLPRALRHLPNLPNIVYSIDLKNPAGSFARFYRSVPKRSAKYVKIVLEKNTDIEVVLRTLRKAKVSAGTPVFLQPVHNKVDKKQLQKFMYILEKSGYIFRVMPQMHKLMKLK